MKLFPSLAGFPRPKLNHRFPLPFLLTLISAYCPAQVSVVEFPVVLQTNAPMPCGITTGPDGNLWFTAINGQRIGKITTAGNVTIFPTSTTAQPFAIAAGADGNLWFTEGNLVGRMTTTGSLTEFSLPGGGHTSAGVVKGPDGSIWTTEQNYIARITPAGLVTEFAPPSGAGTGITAGPDGSLWFTETMANKIGRRAPDGVITEFAIPTADSRPYKITTGPDGNLWFTENSGNKIGRITPAGDITEFPLPPGSGGPTGISAGSDGNVWFLDWDGNKLGKITPTGLVSMFPIPTAASGPRDITLGPDGNLWFTETLANKIAKVNVGPATPSTGGILSFPLRGISPGRNDGIGPYSAPINSVFDHSLRDAGNKYRYYGCDQRVTAYTGEVGNSKPSQGKLGRCPDGSQRHGYAKQEGTSFYVNGNYTGASYLYYDGHPAIDYRAAFGTEVYAAARGVVHYPTQSELDAAKIRVGDDPDNLNVLQLDISETYKLFYLHLSTHPRTVALHLTSNISDVDFVGTRTATPDTGKAGKLKKDDGLSISGRIIEGQTPIAGVTVQLRGYANGCVSDTDVTDADGRYRFSKLNAGYYHVRAFLAGYDVRPARTNVIVPEGTQVEAGALIGLSGNAGPCFAPHLHFEVQRKTTPALLQVTSLHYVPVDPYGWDGDSQQDPYASVPGINNETLWLYTPLVLSVTPTVGIAGDIALNITGRGFDVTTLDCLVRQESVYSNTPPCIRGQLQSRTSTQLIVRYSLSPGRYFVHVLDPQGRRSNWKSVVVP